jgi:hypothetical protein
MMAVFWDVVPCSMHGVISQRTTIFLLVDMRMSNLKFRSLCFDTIKHHE